MIQMLWLALKYYYFFTTNMKGILLQLVDYLQHPFSQSVTVLLFIQSIVVVSEDPNKQIKQGHAGKRKHRTKRVRKNLLQLRGWKVVKAEERLWLHTTLDRQLSML